MEPFLGGRPSRWTPPVLPSTRLRADARAQAAIPEPSHRMRTDDLLADLAEKRAFRPRLGPSVSLPALDPGTRAKPPSQRKPYAWSNFKAQNAKDVNMLLGDLIQQAEREMRTRGVRRSTGYNESRIAVWREVLAEFSAQMPASQLLLARVQHEYDGAIAALVADLKRAESRAAVAWEMQQKAEIAQEAERRLTRALAGEYQPQRPAEAEVDALRESVPDEAARAKLAAIALRSLPAEARAQAVAEAVR